MNPYEVLEIPPDASDKDIKDAYKQLARTWHPDKNKSPNAEEKFKEIGKAYTILSDPQLKMRYDQTGSVDENQQQGVDINEILRGMGMGGFPPGMGMGGFPPGMGGGFPPGMGMGGFPPGMGGMPPGMFGQVFVNGMPMGGMGGGMSQQEMHIRRNLNMKIQVELSLQELFNGVNKKVEYQYKNLENGQVVSDTLELNITKGMHEGQELMMRNRGNKYKDMRGDIGIRIKEARHKDFVRPSSNPAELIYSLKINLVQSICGFEMVIKGIDNQKLVIKNFEKIIKNGDRKVIRNHGMPIFDRQERGNLVIIFEIVYPDAISNEIRNKIAEVFEYDNKSKYNEANAKTSGYILCEMDEYDERSTETEQTEQGERVQCAQQ
jgi:DnaJ-class molecular chaperone